MSKRNFKKIFFGLVLIVGAICAAVAAFYFLEVKPTLESQQNKVVDQTVQASAPAPSAKPPAQPTPEPAAETTVVAPEVTVASKSNDAIKVEVSTTEANAPKESQYGFLWIDRKAGQLVVTLGARQKISVGDKLDVYDKEQKIGQVVVDKTFEGISYVKPIDITPDSFQNDYYRVVKE